MSDILIKNMEMPTGCGAVTLQVWPDGQVEIIDADGEWKTSEAFPVPPHGRLIDARKLHDKCYQHYEDYMNGKLDGKKAILNIEKEIIGAPTIIPAEEGE